MDNQDVPGREAAVRMLPADLPRLKHATGASCCCRLEAAAEMPPLSGCLTGPPLPRQTWQRSALQAWIALQQQRAEAINFPRSLFPVDC